MFRKQTSKENSVVGDIPETSAAFDEKDVPIYVIESNVRNKLREDIERARNEEKRLKNHQKSVRRKEILKKLLCGLTESKSVERFKERFRILHIKKSNSVGSIDIESLEKQREQLDDDGCLGQTTIREADKQCVLSCSSEIALPNVSCAVPGASIYVEDIENNSTYMVDDNDTKSQNNSLETEDDDCNDDCDEFVTMFAWNDPHLKHTSMGVNGTPEYIMNCLDCRVEKAIKEVQEEMKESLAEYYKHNSTRLAIGNHVDDSNVGDDNFNNFHIPDGTLTPRQKRRQRRKYCKTVQREERKKRRKVIEDLIRLEGELNSGMGTYAVAFDTDSQPVEEHTADEMRRYVASKEGIEFPDELALVTITLILLIIMSDYII